MPAPGPVPPHCEAVLAEVSAQLGSAYEWQQQLTGGEQGGAHLVVTDGRPVVLKWEPAGWRAEQLLRAFPAVVRATTDGWSAARWLSAGPLTGGGAFVVQEHVQGSPVSKLDERTVRAVVAANASQQGLAFSGAVDDSGQLEAVLRGDHPWKAAVATFTPAGAALVDHGDRVTAWAGATPVPTSDVVHGDYSSTNLLLDPTGSRVTLVDCQTIGYGSRVRDLADLYRQSVVYPSPLATGVDQLRAAALAAEGPAVFAKCAVAVTYNNLAWWVEHQPAAEFDRACARLHRLFDTLQPARSGGLTPGGAAR